MAGGDVRRRNGAWGAMICPPYRPAGKKLNFLFFFFFVLMEYGNSPYVHSENNKINGRNSHGKILTLESSGTLS